MEKMASKDSAKSKKTTNGLFMCFRPAIIGPDNGSSLGRTDPKVLKHIAAVPEGETVVVSHGNDNKGLSFDKQGGRDFAGKRISATPSRRFSCVWKAVWFEASMARRIKKQKWDKKSPKALTVESARYNHPDCSRKYDFDPGQRLVSRSVSALATSSSASTACPMRSSSVSKTTSFGSNPNESKEINTTNESNAYSQRGYCGCNSGLLLVLVSLLVLVFWGRVCAILCTSAWFFFVPPSRIVKGHRVDSSPESERRIVLAREGGSFRCQ